MSDRARDAARFLAAYAKRFHAGAFATPTRAELAADPTRLHTWTGPGGARTLAWTQTLGRPSRRRDWTGTPVTLPAGARVITHLARDPDAEVPDLSGWDYVFAYREDPGLHAALRSQGRPLVFTRVTAASELIGCYGPPGTPPPRVELPHDLATVVQLPELAVPVELRAAILAEVAAVTAWHDDFPFYSDGSWSAVSLRGFRPDDPRWGIKPSEMPRAWQQAHPEAAAYTCQWTTLADRTPTLRGLVEQVGWWGGLERVRLLQMAGRGGKGGKLARHSDITDKAAGLADGQIARFHLPLVTHPQIVLHAWELNGTHRTQHLPAWTGWYLDARKPHAVVNPTGVDRVHLVIDVVADELVRKHITHAAGHP